MGSLLVPFLAVYTMSGYINGDLLEYGSEAIEVSIAEGQFREIYPAGTPLISIVAITFVLRWLQSRWDGGRRRAWLGIVSAYLEVVWITSVILMIASVKPWQWLADRRAAHALLNSWHDAVDSLGQFSVTAQGLTDWFGSLWGSVAAVLAVPLAWFVVGAVAYGHRMPSTPSPVHPLARRVARGWPALPPLPRRTILALTNDIRSRFGPMVRGARMFTRLGLPAMLVFCLAFVLVRMATIMDWGGSAVLFELARLVVGPQDLETVWRPLSTVIGALSDALIMVLLVCLLAAAVDRVLLAHRPRRPRHAEVTPPEAVRTQEAVRGG